MEVQPIIQSKTDRFNQSREDVESHKLAKQDSKVNSLEISWQLSQKLKLRKFFLNECVRACGQEIV